MTEKQILKIAVKKASQSRCRYKVSAVGFNRKGDKLYAATNRARFSRKRGGVHAEMEVMLKSGPSLCTIFICRVNDKGDMLPIHPCGMCREKAAELGVKIVSL